MKETTVTITPTVQERLAYAWAVLSSEFAHLPSVNDRVLTRCREAAHQLTEQEALELLADVPALVIN